MTHAARSNATRSIRIAGAAILLAAGLATGFATLQPRRCDLRLAAAISMREALTSIVHDFEQQSGAKVELTFGASGQLLAQIRNGAPVDVFVSAGRDQVDALLKEGLVRANDVRVVAGNEVVCIVPSDAAAPPASFADLAAPRVTRIAIGDPATVPAGKYAAQVFEKLNLQTAVQERLILGANVRQVLSYVERGEVSAGIVYATDARRSGQSVRIVATADPRWHAPIEYPAAVLLESGHRRRAVEFLTFLDGAAAHHVLQAAGFSTPHNEPDSDSSDAHARPLSGPANTQRDGARL